MTPIDRRTFIKTASSGAVALGMTGLSGANLSAKSPVILGNNSVVKNNLPRWRGFNILQFFRPSFYDGFFPWPYEAVEQDFKWIADWGFDFVRLPISYRYYVNYNSYGAEPITPEETVSFNEDAIETIEQVVYLAHKYKLHVSINLHRAPGYCIINEGIKEPFDLWADVEAQQAFCLHWEMWAKRFKNVSTELLSFNLVNEPLTDKADTYRKVTIDCLEAIRRHNPKRMVIADGLNFDVAPNLEDLDLHQGCRGYNPGKISHFRNPWSGDINDSILPVWKKEDRKMLEEYYRPWIELKNRGIGVHCGECGSYNKTPHDVFIAWITDVLDILTTNDIGWALWNFRGSFGVLDSGRKDVAYENWYGHKIDRKLLDLLQNH